MMFVVSAPLIFGYSLPPAKMDAASNLYDLVDNIDLKEGDIAFIALDFGPNTKAENEPQAANLIEHLMRRRIPFAVFSQYQNAVGFLDSIPRAVAKRLNEENPAQVYTYGTDWVNLGYRPGRSLFIQGLAKSDDLVEYFKKDASGTKLKEVPAFQKVKTIRNVRLLGEFTGLVGMFDTYVQFFQRDGYVPEFVHGCTSITIPEAFIYLDSGQLKGLLEGIAGAAWYSYLLKEHYPDRGVDSAMLVNTALGVAHLAIIFLILLGNGLMVYQMLQKGKRT